LAKASGALNWDSTSAKRWRNFSMCGFKFIYDWRLTIDERSASRRANRHS
jgi:hypothetical protein